MAELKEKYIGIHQQMLTADSEAVESYTASGSKKAGKTESMWIYEGNEH